MKLMLKESLVMHFTRMVKIPNYLIPWKILTLMYREEAFTAIVSYKECDKRLHLFQSIQVYI
jgi:hypothetical protein